MKLLKIIKNTGLALLASAFMAFAGPGEVKVMWDANNPADGVTTYRVYYGRASGNYTGSFDVPSAPVDDNGIMRMFYTLKLDGGRYFSAVTALNASGDESGYSNEISFVLPNKPVNHKKAPQGQATNQPTP